MRNCVRPRASARPGVPHVPRLHGGDVGRDREVARLQAALWREAYSLVDRGVVTVADIDTAISQGPGLRWAVLGPFANQHLSGGAGGNFRCKP